MKGSYAFFNSWDRFMLIGAFFFIGVAVVIFLFHEYRVLKIKDPKEKYDYVNLYEIKYFWYSVIALIAAAAFFINTLGTYRIVTQGMFWFYVRMFLTVSFAIIAYFVFFGMVRIYYPRNIEKRLQRLRDKPRISPAGNVMRKLTEDEEDEYLEESQIAEEASTVHSIDYDVWLDEKTGYTRVEKYYNYQRTEECPECGYFTLKIDSEEIEVHPTLSSEGILLKHYQCAYCQHREARQEVLDKLSKSQK